MSRPHPPVKILVVDDSALVRAHMKKQIGALEGATLVGLAPDPFVARDILLKEQPDLVLLDVEMPRMDGLTFLKLIMRHKPTPTIVISSVTPKGSSTALACLEAGALDVLCKPGGAYSVDELQDQIAAWIREVGRQGSARLAQRQASIAKLPEPNTPTAAETITTTNRIVAIGSSAGGPETLRQLLGALPRASPGIVLCQHMGTDFLARLAERLDEECRIEVKLAAHGDSVVPGRALLAPGDSHTRVGRVGARYEVRLEEGGLISGHRPSVDALFESVAGCAGANAMGVILTGMGNDGAAGMRAMHDAGSFCVAQDEATSVVYGMPARAVEAGGVDRSLPLGSIPNEIVAFAARADRRSA